MYDKPDLQILVLVSWISLTRVFAMNSLCNHNAVSYNTEVVLSLPRSKPRGYHHPGRPRDISTPTQLNLRTYSFHGYKRWMGRDESAKSPRLVGRGGNRLEVPHALLQPPLRCSLGPLVPPHATQLVHQGREHPEDPDDRCNHNVDCFVVLRSLRKAQPHEAVDDAYGDADATVEDMHVGPELPALDLLELSVVEVSEQRLREQSNEGDYSHNRVHFGTRVRELLRHEQRLSATGS